MAVSRRSTRSLAKPAAPDKLEPTCCTSQVNHTDNAFREPSRGGAGCRRPNYAADGGRRYEATQEGLIPLPAMILELDDQSTSIC